MRFPRGRVGESLGGKGGGEGVKFLPTKNYCESKKKTGRKRGRRNMSASNESSLLSLQKRGGGGKSKGEKNLRQGKGGKNSVRPTPKRSQPPLMFGGKKSVVGCFMSGGKEEIKKGEGGGTVFCHFLSSFSTSSCGGDKKKKLGVPRLPYFRAEGGKRRLQEEGAGPSFLDKITDYKRGGGRKKQTKGGGGLSFFSLLERFSKKKGGRKRGKKKPAGFRVPVRGGRGAKRKGKPPRAPSFFQPCYDKGEKNCRRSGRHFPPCPQSRGGPKGEKKRKRKG